MDCVWFFLGKHDVFTGMGRLIVIPNLTIMVRLSELGRQFHHNEFGVDTAIVLNSVQIGFKALFFEYYWLALLGTQLPSLLLQTKEGSISYLWAYGTSNIMCNQSRALCTSHLQLVTLILVPSLNAILMWPPSFVNTVLWCLTEVTSWLLSWEVLGIPFHNLVFRNSLTLSLSLSLSLRFEIPGAVV